MMQPQGHSFLERKGQVKQLFLKSLPDCRNRVIPAMSSQMSALKSHITDASQSFTKLPQESPTTAASKGEQGGGKEIQGCCTIFTLVVLLADSSLKRQDHLATNNSQVKGQANKMPVSLFCGGVTGWQSRQ